MTHEELLAKINKPQAHTIQYTGLGSEIEILTLMASRNALRVVVELHKPDGNFCSECSHDFDYLFNYPCSTIQAIEKAFS